MKFPLGLWMILGCIHAILTVPAHAQRTITYLDLVDTTVEEVTIGAERFSTEQLPQTAATGNCPHDPTQLGTLIYNMNAVQDTAPSLDTDCITSSARDRLPSVASIPEPSAAMLLLLASSGLIARRSRR